MTWRVKLTIRLERFVNPITGQPAVLVNWEVEHFQGIDYRVAALYVSERHVPIPDWSILVAARRWWGTGHHLLNVSFPWLEERACELAGQVLEDGKPRLLVEDPLARQALEAAGYDYLRGHAALEDLAHGWGDCHRQAWKPHSPEHRVCGDPRCKLVAFARAARGTRC